MPRAPRLLVRAEVGPRVGMGHLLRCLAVAAAWLPRGPVVVALEEASPDVTDRVTAIGASLLLLGAGAGAGGTARACRDAGASAVLVDGYGFDEPFLRELRRSLDVPVALMHDGPPAGGLPVDVVVDAAAGSEDVPAYRRAAPRARVLVGVEHVVLRPELLRGRAQVLPLEQRHRLLVTAGGSDPRGLAPRVLRALRGVDTGDLRVRVVLGDLSPHEDEVAELAGHLPGASWVRRAPDMALEVLQARAAVSAAGGTAWELALLGVPSLLVDVADNQRPVAAALHSRGAAVWTGGVDSAEDGRLVSALEDLGLRDCTAGSPLHRTAAAASAVIDGGGAERVALALADAVDASAPEVD